MQAALEAASDEVGLALTDAFAELGGEFSEFGWMLAAFQAEDAQWFFGRQRLVAELVVRLSEAPFLAVVGPSGSGKSSALRAGLLPAVGTAGCLERKCGPRSW